MTEDMGCSILIGNIGGLSSPRSLGLGVVGPPGFWGVGGVPPVFHVEQTREILRWPAKGPMFHADVSRFAPPPHKRISLRISPRGYGSCSPRLLQFGCGWRNGRSTNDEDRQMPNNIKATRTTAQTLTDQCNEDDGVFEALQTALAFYCESRGLDEEDFVIEGTIVVRERTEDDE